MKPDQNHDRPDDRFLADFLDAARVEAPELSSALRTRILADAMAAQPGTRHSSQTPSRLKRLRLLLAGWAAPTLAGGASAALAGFWIGIAAPLPEGAPEAAYWLLQSVSALDIVSDRIVGLDDPFFMGF